MATVLRLLGWRLRGEPGVAAYAVRVIAIFNRVKAAELVGYMRGLGWEGPVELVGKEREGVWFLMGKKFLSRATAVGGFSLETAFSFLLA
jgi:hypothetical protein